MWLWLVNEEERKYVYVMKDHHHNNEHAEEDVEKRVPCHDENVTSGCVPILLVLATTALIFHHAITYIKELSLVFKKVPL